MSKPLFIETIKVRNSEFYNFELHQARLQKTAKHFYGTTPQLKLLAQMIPDNLKQGLVKCRVTYADQIALVEFEPYTFKKIESLRVVEADSIDYKYKSTNRTELNKLYEQRGDASDVIIAQNGLVTDSSYANLVFENTDGLFTPKHCLLKGVKRQQLLDEGRIEETEITVSAISSFSKVYLINAMIDLEDDVSTSQVYY